MLEKYLEQIMSWLESGAMWIGEQAPLYVQELLTWRMWNHAIWNGLMLILLVATITSSIKFFKWVKAKTTSSDGPGVGLTLSIIASVGLFIGIVANTCALIKIIVAPKVYLIDYITFKLSI